MKGLAAWPSTSSGGRNHNDHGNLLTALGIVQYTTGAFEVTLMLT